MKSKRRLLFRFRFVILLIWPTHGQPGVHSVVHAFPTIPNGPRQDQEGDAGPPPRLVQRWVLTHCTSDAIGLMFPFGSCLYFPYNILWRVYAQNIWEIERRSAPRTCQHVGKSCIPWTQRLPLITLRGTHGATRTTCQKEICMLWLINP